MGAATLPFRVQDVTDLPRAQQHQVHLTVGGPLPGGRIDNHREEFLVGERRQVRDRGPQPEHRLGGEDDQGTART
jgi:hypothetical protein